MDNIKRTIIKINLNIDNMNKEIKLTIKENNRYEIIKDLINNKLSNKEASKKLNLSIRQTQRLKRKVEIQEKKEKCNGILGIIHGLRNREGNRKKTQKWNETEIIKLRKKYHDFNIQYFQEKLKENHNISIPYTSLRKVLINHNMFKVKKRKVKEKHFMKRERKENYGEMIQFDGSYHDWFEGRCIDKEFKKEQCLLVSIDDATNRITKLKFEKNEGKEIVFKFWKEYVVNMVNP